MSRGMAGGHQLVIVWLCLINLVNNAIWIWKVANKPTFLALMQKKFALFDRLRIAVLV